MGYPVSIATTAGRIGGWRADPAIPAKGALVVVQEIFGVNAHIREVVERFAAQGFVALAPALFDCIEPDIELEYTPDGVARGRDLVEQLGFDRAVAMVDAAACAVAEVGKVGAVGYCWGGTVAFLANTRLKLPAVSYYGGRTVPFLHERLSAPMLFLFGENDPIISAEDIARHRERQPQASFHVYAAGHGFNCDQRADFNQAAATDALARTLTFFTRTLT
ncbi:MAG: carboxymethylenebutenolidase [Lysobacterales bacterium CG17_big_fil_post_rev_8_21_14_2_50_64_11]|nr:MAG: carboxymethylenebutenolidase [Xanthomonadales bacterium CG17_big_fil_post_rev_8_21_14_2_50_64_11]PIX59276.1 MAG: carboxymethylenebutenolidase [Xanthomonadales bacterium CG_4_10_14_3_um_filter_64_11]